jgi:hypothetical protein
MELAGYIGLVLMILSCGCVASASTLTDRHDTSSPGVKAVTLKDVHPLYGGENVYLRPDGSGFAQLVVARATPPGLHERRFTLPPAPAVMLQIAQALRDHDFFNISLSDRAGMPNEARTTIAIELASGRAHRVSKWANDPHSGFEAIHQMLRGRARGGQLGQLVYEGRFDPHWLPSF